VLFPLSLSLFSIPLVLDAGDPKPFPLVADQAGPLKVGLKGLSFLFPTVGHTLPFRAGIIKTGSFLFPSLRRVEIRPFIRERFDEDSPPLLCRLVLVLARASSLLLLAS